MFSKTKAKVTCHDCKCVLYKDDARSYQNLARPVRPCDFSWELSTVYFCRSCEPHVSLRHKKLLKDGEPIVGITTKGGSEGGVASDSDKKKKQTQNYEYDYTPPQDTPAPRGKWDRSKWSAKWDVDQCQGCGRDDINHAAKGYCKLCYMNKYND